jgi:hypothetical protein
MDGTTTRQRRRQWTARQRCERGDGNEAMRCVNGKWRRDARRKVEATPQKVTRQPAIKANERRIRGGRRRRTRGGAAATRKGTWSFILGEMDPLCPRALMAIHMAYCDYGSGPLVMATGGGGGGGDPAAFVVVAAPHVVVSAPVIVVVTHRPSPFPYVAECLSPDLC